MREIKFRAWGRNEKKMLYGVEHTYDGYIVPMACFGGVLDCPDFYIVMQYTGLKDQNGKEIYEGDIVKFYPQSPRSEELPNPRYGEMGEIFFDIGSFAVRPIDRKREGLEFFLNELGEWVVVGNIYENLKFLEQNIKS